jgi:hypothetical protein
MKTKTLINPLLVSLCLLSACATHAQNSTIYAVRTDSNSIVLAPTNFFTANAAAELAAIGPLLSSNGVTLQTVSNIVNAVVTAGTNGSALLNYMQNEKFLGPIEMGSNFVSDFFANFLGQIELSGTVSNNSPSLTPLAIGGQLNGTAPLTTWSSNGTAVASVSSGGVITAPGFTASGLNLGLLATGPSWYYYPAAFMNTFSAAANGFQWNNLSNSIAWMNLNSGGLALQSGAFAGNGSGITNLAGGSVPGQLESVGTGQSIVDNQSFMTWLLTQQQITAATNRGNIGFLANNQTWAGNNTFSANVIANGNLNVAGTFQGAAVNGTTATFGVMNANSSSSLVVPMVVTGVGSTQTADLQQWTPIAMTSASDVDSNGCFGVVANGHTFSIHPFGMPLNGFNFASINELDLAFNGTTNLQAKTATNWIGVPTTFTGPISLTASSTVTAVIHDTQSLTNDQTIAAANLVGNGSGITSISGSSISSGTVADARLSSNIPLLNGANNFTGQNASSVSNGFGGVVTFAATAVVTNNAASNTVTGPTTMLAPLTNTQPISASTYYGDGSHLSGIGSGSPPTFNNAQFASAGGTTNLKAGITLTNVVADNAGGATVEVPAITATGGITVGSTNGTLTNLVQLSAGTWALAQNNAVPWLRPQNLGTALAFDIMPNTTNANGLTTWMDVCATDVARTNAQPGNYYALAMQCDAGGNGEIFTHAGGTFSPGTLSIQNYSTAIQAKYVGIRCAPNQQVEIGISSSASPDRFSFYENGSHGLIDCYASGFLRKPVDFQATSYQFYNTNLSQVLMSLGTNGTMGLAGTISNYNSIATADAGVVAVRGSVHVTSQSASIVPTSIIATTPNASSMYDVSIVLTPKTASGSSTVALSVKYQDINGLQTNTPVTLSWSTLAAPTNAVISLVSSNATSISYYTTLTGSGTYNADVSVKQIE